MEKYSYHEKEVADYLMGHTLVHIMCILNELFIFV